MSLGGAKDDAELARLLCRASLAALKLANIVRLDSGIGVIERAELERDYPVPLRAMRDAWRAAERAARIPGATDPRWRCVLRPPDAPEDPPRWFNIGPTLEADPTQADLVRLNQIHQVAGWLSDGAKLFDAHAKHNLANLKANKGACPDELALGLAGKLHANLEALAEVVAVFEVGEQAPPESIRRLAQARATAWRKRKSRSGLSRQGHCGLRRR